MSSSSKCPLNPPQRRVPSTKKELKFFGVPPGANDFSITLDPMNSPRRKINTKFFRAQSFGSALSLPKQFQRRPALTTFTTTHQQQQSSSPKPQPRPPISLDDSALLLNSGPSSYLARNTRKGGNSLSSPDNYCENISIVNKLAALQRADCKNR